MMADSQKDDFLCTAGLDLPSKKPEHLKSDSSSSKNKKNNNRKYRTNFIILKIPVNRNIFIFIELKYSKHTHMHYLI